MPPDSSAPLRTPALVVVGGSVRFLANSCRQAGWQVYAADRFGDRDLLDAAAGFRPLPSDLDQAEDPFPEWPDAPFLFTGGLENHPAFLERLAATHPIAAASPSAVRAVRDLAALARVAADVGLRVPQTHTTPAGLPLDGSYLVKPVASVGGQGIALWRGGPPPPRPSHWQRRCQGISYGVSVVIRERASAELLGVCERLPCRNSTAAPGWAYAGSVTVPTPAWADTVLAFADQLASQHGLRGVVGIDCLANDSQPITILEVNPRPTASMELFERTRGLSIARCHLDAIGFASPQTTGPQHSAAPASGKAILFTDAAMRIEPDFADALAQCAAEWSVDNALPVLADLPQHQTCVPAASPLLTLFADAETSNDVNACLLERLSQLRTLCNRFSGS